MSEPREGAEVASSNTGLARASALMAAGTLTSRVLGMVRGILLSAVLGLAITGSTFDVANTLPNNFYLLIAGGILNAVLVPQIAKAASHDDGGEDFVNRLLTLAIAFMAVATVLATAAAPLLVRIFASSSWGSDEMALAVTFAFICLPQIFFYGLYTLLGQVLNARGRFTAYMWAPVFANVVAIAGLVIFLARGLPRRAPAGDWSPEMLFLVAGMSTLGIVLQALVLIVPLRRIGFRYRPVWGFRGVGLGGASRVAMWTFAAIAVSQLGFIVTSQVLTHADAVAQREAVQGAGKVVYTNAFLLFMLPHSLVTVSLVTALFTRLSYAAHEGRRRDVLHDLGRGLRMPAVVLIPATFGGILLAPWITHSIYLGNTIPETDAIAHVLVAMLFGLVPFGWLYLVQRTFYAYEDAKTPFYLQVVVTVIATVVNLLSIALPPQWVGVGVGVGQTASNLVAAVLGFLLLRRRLGRLRLQAVVQQNVRLILASAVATAVSGALLLLMWKILGVGRVAVLLTLVVVGAVFVVVALAGAARLRVKEVHEVLGPLARRLGRGTA
ncbi:Integral membrane protein MviN [Nostocoides japonicum T1-X7]|uniref:Integral membrane protein MviN n=1 Tax=Nostocoides japonicum T1-X7 TaxID=1194083 RepID=A0A077LWS1_9MICO|nr:murein biosynthesis integral membrane protein MurJ [Tetrasphaera japonica]CCH78373.1 Integral membrane protein MviN [Tetrasphaera japonica T1-X7]